MKQMLRQKKKPQANRRAIYQVATFSFKDNIIKVAKNRSDDVAKTVFARIEYEYDLVAAEAKYHNNYYNSFLRPSSGGKIGRPEDNSIILAMEEIFAFLKIMTIVNFHCKNYKIFAKIRCQMIEQLKKG